MPGIAGIIGSRVSEETKVRVASMLDSMQHEPDYVRGLHYSEQCGAYVGWLSHPNSFACVASQEVQPDLQLAFCGEIFLDQASQTSASLLDWYRRNGPDFVSELNGLFSGVLLDGRQGSAFVFVDRFGSERIYLHESDGCVYFASEAKALLRILPDLRELDVNAVADFLVFGSCKGPRTLFKGISRVSEGTTLEYRSGVLDRRYRYFDPTRWTGEAQLSEKEFEAAFVEIAREVVPRYARSEEEIGFSITGGLDTRMALACVPASSGDLHCYTYGAAKGDTLDVLIGRKIATSLGYSHQTLRMSEHFLSNFQRFVDESVYVSDGCCTALSAHELYFSKLARAIAPIRLTGNFGSEVLRSMSTLEPKHMGASFLVPEFESKVEEAVYSRGSRNSLMETVLDEIPTHLYGTVAIARSQLTFRTPYLDNEIVALAFRAPLSSRRSPNPALRLIATGNKVLRSIPTDMGYSCGKQWPWDSARVLLRRTGFKLDYLDKEGLTPKLSAMETIFPLLQASGVLGQHKFLPYRRWFQDELVDSIDAAVSRAAAGFQPWFKPDALARICREHSLGRVNHLETINALLTLDAVQRTLVVGEYNRRPTQIHTPAI